MNAPSGIARAFSVALSFSLIGCGGNEAVLSTDTRVVLARPVVNMDSTTAVLQSTFQELSQGTYIFRGGTVVLDTGDVIVGSAGDGYLRLVRSVTRNGTLLQLETDPAALTDAIAEGEFSATFSTNTPGTSLRATSIVEQPLLPGVTVGNGQINFDNVLVFGNSTNGFSISGGHIAFKPSATLEGSIHHRSITHFKASVAGNITLDADLVLRSAGVFERSDSIPFYT
ncbi:MAG: hypothetical protein ACRELE_02125, partial [Gemmatimonadales bacterium]